MKNANTLVSAENVSKHFVIHRSLLSRVLAGQKNLLVRAVDGVSFSIREGETLGLVGESGCGKSTLGRLVLHIHRPTEGKVYFQGQDVGKFEGSKLYGFRRKAQIIFQNPYSSLNPRKTVRDILSVPLLRKKMKNPVEREKEIYALLARVGLADYHINNYPHQFSGGQRQRIGIARALAMDPTFIVADEPVSALDVSVQAQIINLLEKLQQDLKLTYLFITHDLSVIYYMSTRVAVMYLGKIVEVADTMTLFDHPRHPYTKALLSAIPIVDKEARRQRIILEGTVPSPINVPPGCRFHPRCPERIGPICAEEEPVFHDPGAGHLVACHLHSK